MVRPDPLAAPGRRPSESGSDDREREARRTRVGPAGRWLLVVSLAFLACRSGRRPKFPEPIGAGEAWGDALPGSGPAATDLRFSDFFEMPVGSKGLRYTETARRMEGRRVRIVGFMVRQDQPTPGIFLLAPFPLPAR